MILVTSAAGNTGRAMVNNLVNSGEEVLATDINPFVEELPGVSEAMIGDLADLSFLETLMRKVDKVIYIPPLFSAQESLIGKRLIDLSVENGIDQFIFISVIHSILTSLLQHTAKRDVEEYLIYKGMESQIPYTILQPMHYMHNFNPKLVKNTGLYEAFYDLDSKIGYVSTRDVAEVTQKILNSSEKHNKATYELVGTEPYSPKELVSVFNNVTHLNATAKYIPVDTFLNNLGAQDLYFREGFKKLADSYTKWGLDGNSYVLKALLEHEPETFEQYILRNL